MQDCYADVIVDITSEKLDRVFQYRVPDKMQDALEPGMVVEIPFGAGNRKIRGYVTAISGHTDYDPEKIKEIASIVTDGVGAESRLIGLAAWIRNRYGSTMIQALKVVLPVKRKVRGKDKKTVYLILDKPEAQEKLKFFQKKHQTARARLLEALIEEQAIPYELVTEKLNVASGVVKALEQQGIVTLKSEKIYRNPVSVSVTENYAVCLNEEQRRITDEIIREWEEKPNGRYLIHGVTGSGKTEVYMELIAHAVSRGQQAIVLIPEIALTYQTVIRFYHRFGDRVSVINSRLSAGERYDQFERARQGELDVMIGPRSALFTPFPNLGVIVIDEEHEPAYQSETVPRYHAREAALQRGKMEGAKVVLGSATPSLEAYYGAQNGQFRLFTLKQRAGMAALPQVSVVDLRQELREGNRSILSRELHRKMEECLAGGDQMMLFLNRRGYAGFVSCRACGHVLKCPHCDVSLALHKGGKLICHYCGYEEPIVKKCPVCGSGFIRSFKAGTQQIEEEVKKEFPGARILRMDMELYAPFSYVGSESDGYKHYIAVSNPLQHGSKLQIRLKGIIDRMDSKDGILRIVDYKTGRNKGTPATIDDLFPPTEFKKRKKEAFQIFYYAYIMSRQPEFCKYKLAPTLLYTRTSSKPTPDDIYYRIGNDAVTDFNSRYGREFEEKLISIITEIFNPDIPFSPTGDKETCRNCDFSQLCGRN